MTPDPTDRQLISQADRADGDPPSPADVAACAERLEQLTLRVAEFVRDQINQVEDLCGSLAETADGRAGWEQMSRELRQQRIHWEQEKAAQAEQIAAETEILTAAWDEIEAERRRLLTDGCDTASPPPAETSPVPEAESLHPSNLFDFGVPGSGHSAVLQFQQIKREIRQHARRHT